MYYLDEPCETNLLVLLELRAHHARRLLTALGCVFSVMSRNIAQKVFNRLSLIVRERRPVLVFVVEWRPWFVGITDVEGHFRSSVSIVSKTSYRLRHGKWLLESITGTS